MNNLNAKEAKAKEQKEAKAVKAKEQKEAKEAKAKEQKEAKEAKAKDKKEAKVVKDMEDDYTKDILRNGYYSFIKNCEDSRNRHRMVRLPNMPEDISENIAKNAIRNHDGEPNIKWAKAITINGKKVKGDLYSSNYPLDSQPEVKSFASDGPLTFGPKKKFGVLYCLDLTGAFDNDNLILWRINLTNDSPEWKCIKMNKKQSNDDQCIQGRRPRICWKTLYPQIAGHCVKVYEGSFEGIFEPLTPAPPTPEPTATAPTATAP
jgi:hypothetical protein